MDKDTLQELCFEVEVWFFSNVHGAVAVMHFFVYSEFTLIQEHNEQKKHSVIQVQNVCEGNL
jgi:hypothetical protein